MDEVLAKRLLKRFDEPQFVGMACHHEFDDATYWPAQQILAESKHLGLVIEREGSPPIVNSTGVYYCDVILTDAGRDFCGLPRLNRPVVVKEAKPKQGNLF